MYYIKYNYLICKIKNRKMSIYMYSPDKFDESKMDEFNRDILSEVLSDNLISEQNSNLISKNELNDLEIGKCPICYDSLKLIIMKMMK